MDYNYLIETKNEFLNAVIGILTPQIYNGLITMYDHSSNVFAHLKKKIEINPKNISLQIVNYFKLKTNDFSKMTIEEVENEYHKIKIDIFKKYVNDIASKNNMEIEGEYLRIKNESRFSDIFDSLIKACFKSYLLFFTFDPKTKNSTFNSEKYYENINIRDFIHKCYVETCTFFQNNPELFIKRNKKTEINEHIKTCIIMSIRKSLPYNDMIREYLRIDLDMKQNKIEELKKMEQLVNNIMEKNKSKNIIDIYDMENNYNKSKINKIINKNKNKIIIKSDSSISDEIIKTIDNNNIILEEETSIDKYENNKKESNIDKRENNKDKSSIDIYNTENYKTNGINTDNKIDNNDDKSDNIDNDNSDNDNSDNDNSDNENSDNENSDNDSSDNDNSDNDNSDTSSMETEKLDVDNDSDDVKQKKSVSIITSLASIPKRTTRISKIKNTIDKNMENFYNDLII